MESYLGIMHKARNHAIIPFIHRIQCLSGNGSLVILRLLVGEGAFAKPNSYTYHVFNHNIFGRTTLTTMFYDNDVESREISRLI